MRVALAVRLSKAIARNILITVTVSTGCLLQFKPVIAATSASEYRSLGLSYRASERYSEAIAALKKAVELEPQNLSGRVMLGWTQHLAGQEEAAAETLLQAIYRDPRHVPAHNALGIVYLVSGELNAAVIIHSWAALLEPKNEIAYYNLSLALHRLQLYNIAIPAAKQAAKLEPNNPHPLVAAAISYWDMGDRNSAKLAYQRARNLDARYGDRSFLAHLQQAGFSLEQIQKTELILANSQ